MYGIERFFKSGFAYFAPLLAVIVSAQLGVSAGTLTQERTAKLASPAYQIKVLLKNNDYAAAQTYLDSAACSLDEEAWLYWSARVLLEKETHNQTPVGNLSSCAQEMEVAENYLKASMRFGATAAKYKLLKQIEAEKNSVSALPLVSTVLP